MDQARGKDRCFLRPRGCHGARLLADRDVDHYTRSFGEVRDVIIIVIKQYGVHVVEVRLLSMMYSMLKNRRESNEPCDFGRN